MRTASRAAAAVEAADEDLSEYKETFLMCRDLRHAWRYAGHWKAGRGFGRELVCSRCRTRREDTWESGMVRRAYRYPAGYQMEHKVDPSDVRAEILRRVDLYDSHEAMLAGVNRSKRHGQAKVIDLREAGHQRRGRQTATARR